MVLRDFACDVKQFDVVYPGRRIVRLCGGAQQTFEIIGCRRRHDLDARRVPQHGLRAVGVLSGTAAANAVIEMENHWYLALSARHVVDIRRFVDDLRERLEYKACGRNVHDRSKTGHHGFIKFRQYAVYLSWRY